VLIITLEGVRARLGAKVMNVNEILLKKNIDDEMLSFIKSNVNTFGKLDIIRFFGLNSSSRVDVETLSEVTNSKIEETEKSVKELAKAHIIEEINIEGKKLYELSPNKTSKELITSFISYYSKSSIRMLIVGYLLNKSIEEKI